MSIRGFGRHCMLPESFRRGLAASPPAIGPGNHLRPSARRPAAPGAGRPRSAAAFASPAAASPAAPTRAPSLKLANESFEIE
jgi:hypothetical protein